VQGRKRPHQRKKNTHRLLFHSGNTREISLQIQEATGRDVFEIVPVDPYPTNYSSVVDQAKKELREDCRPQLKTKVPNMDAYDVVFVGSPQFPVVDTERCIGCGACENLCPSRPLSAIYVEGHQTHRVI